MNWKAYLFGVLEFLLLLAIAFGITLLFNHGNIDHIPFMIDWIFTSLVVLGVDVYYEKWKRKLEDSE